MKLFFRGKNQRQAGVTLIEVLITIFLLAIISISLYGLFLFAGRLVTDAKIRMVGLYLANEEMEKIKSMNYSNIGTQGGVPEGDLLQLQTINKAGIDFEVGLEIKFLDDEIDGEFPEDDRPADYKVVRLEISWPGSFEKNEITLVSSIYSQNADEEGGVVSLNAVDFAGTGVPECEVEILEPNLDPPVDIHTGVDETGNVILYGMPGSTGGYEIKLRRDGYEEVTTYPAYPTSSFYPVDEHLLVEEGTLNTKSITIDKLGELRLTVKDEIDGPLGDLSLAVKGGRILGHTGGADSQPVYGFNEEDLRTDGEGIIEILEARRGNYEVLLNSSGYEIVGVGPAYPFGVPPGEVLEVEIKCVRETLTSLLVMVTDSETEEPLSSAAAAVTGLNFSEVGETDDLGKAFFWQEGMEAGDYQIEISMDGYEDYTGTASVNELTKKEVLLVRE